MIMEGSGSPPTTGGQTSPRRREAASVRAASPLPCHPSLLPWGDGWALRNVRESNIANRYHPLARGGPPCIHVAISWFLQDCTAAVAFRPKRAGAHSPASLEGDRHEPWKKGAGLCYGEAGRQATILLPAAEDSGQESMGRKQEACCRLHSGFHFKS